MGLLIFEQKLGIHLQNNKDFIVKLINNKLRTSARYDIQNEGLCVA
jgi:hypothetical protein